MPTAKPLEAVFLLLEFGCGELLDADLLVDLGKEFRAVAPELGPLLVSLGAKARNEHFSREHITRLGLEHQHFPRSFDRLGEGAEPLDDTTGGWPTHESPHPGPERHPAGLAQLPPCGHPVP